MDIYRLQLLLNLNDYIIYAININNIEGFKDGCI